MTRAGTRPDASWATKAGAGHATIAEPEEGLGDERMGEAPPAPRPAGEDAGQPATTDAECLVLGGLDAVDHAAGHLVAVEGDHPQGQIRLGVGEPALEVLVRVIEPAPMVSEGLDACPPDPLSPF